MAKCPKCDQLLTNVELSDVSARAPFGRWTWKAIAYCCPSCKTTLSVAIDPVSLKADLVNDLMVALKSDH